MAKAPPMSNAGQMMMLIPVAALVALAAWGGLNVVSGLFQFIVWVLSPLWETVGHWLPEQL